MLKIGLTGGIGSGKTTISNLFADLGVPVIDADVIARGLLEPGHPAFEKTIQVFGQEILDQGGRVDRRQLRLRVFNHPEERKCLESILHPFVRQDIQQQSAALNTSYCLVVIPLLVEAQQIDLVDRILVIQSNEDSCLLRVMARDQITATEARKIMATQTSEKKRMALADDVIDNSGDIDELKDRVRELHQRYLSLADEH